MMCTLSSRISAQKIDPDVKALAANAIAAAIRGYMPRCGLFTGHDIVHYFVTTVASISKAFAEPVLPVLAILFSIKGVVIDTSCSTLARDRV